MKILYVSLLINIIVHLSGQPVSLRRGSQELFVSKVIRVRRQAGYVYNKPSVSFDLPTRAPSLTVTTQAPTVDRTQAQMMYYAYPVPATGGSAGNTGASSGATAGNGGGTSSSGAASAGSSGGYGASNAASASAQFAPTTGSSQTGSAQSSSVGSSGYGYNAPSLLNTPVSTGSTQQSNNAGSSGYGYNAPSAGAIQVSNSVESTQTGSAGSSQTGSIAGSGYEYNNPINTANSGVTPATDVSTNAPKYLPPTPGGGSSNNILPSSGLTRGETSAVSGSSAIVTKPLDQYLPPLISQSEPPSVPLLTDQYLPPNGPLDSPAPINPSVNKEVQGYSGTGPNSNYIPPNLSQSPPPVTNVTPRPFSPAPLSDGYLPPIPNSQASGPNIPSTPAAPYLPPVL